MLESNKQTEYSPDAALPAGESAAPQGGITPQIKPSCPKRAARKRDLRLAAVLLVWGFLLWDCLFWARGLGAGETLALVGIPITAALWLRQVGKKRTGYGTACWLLCLAGALSLAFSGDDNLKLLTFWGMIPLFLVWVTERMDLRSGTGLRARLHDLLTVGVAMTVGRLPEGCWALFKGSGTDTRRKRFNGVLIGLLCAVPVLLVLVPMLVSSDAAFEGLMGRLDWDSVVRGVIALGAGFCTMLLLFSLLFTSDRPGAPLRGSGFPGVEPAAVISFLAAISVAYLTYLAAQFAYFTDAFRGLLPKNYTVAQYARRGFFEMCGIVAINLGLIVVAGKLCRKPEGKLPGAVKGLSLFLCVFSLLLVATALSKMGLYMNALGLTRLRVLTSVFMLWLAAVIAAAGLRLFARKIPVLQLAVGTGAAVLILLSLANVDGLVARYNVNAYRTGRLDSLDTETVCFLGDGAVPALTELLDDENPAIAKKAREELRQRLAVHGLAEVSWRGSRLTALYLPVNEPDDLRSWNLISAHARTVLLENRDRILAGGADPE